MASDGPLAWLASRWRGVVAVVLLGPALVAGEPALLAEAGPAATPAEVPTRVLPPSVAPLLQQALERMPAAVSVGDAAIDPARVRFQACRAAEPGQCLAVTLSDPDEPCAGVAKGAWCVTTAPVEGLDDVRDAVVGALATLTERQVWSRLETDAEAAARRQASRTPDPPWSVHRDDTAYRLADLEAGLPRWLAALLAVTVPLAAGLGLGRVVRGVARRRVGGALAAAALGLAPFAAWPVLDPSVVPLGLLDEVLALGAVGAGALAGAHRAFRREAWGRWGLAAASTALSLLAVEGALRLLLPTPPAFPAVARQQLFTVEEPTGRSYFADAICRAIYPQVAPDALTSRLEQAARGPRTVLHLGDSMASGYGTRDDLAYPVLLAGRTGDLVHVNAAVPTAGGDHYLLILRAWRERLPLAGVVLHFFTGNDVADLDAPSPCCAFEPWLVYDGPGPRARCPEPRVGVALAARAWALQGPFVLRVLAPSSALAAWSLAALERGALSLRPAVDDATRLAHLRAILAAMKADLDAAHVPLAVVLVPYRWALEEPDRAASEGWKLHADVASMVGELGIGGLDPWDDLGRALEGSEAASWWAALVPRDIHFSEKGNRWMADWLAPRLLPALGISP